MSLINKSFISDRFKLDLDQVDVDTGSEVLTIDLSEEVKQDIGIFFNEALASGCAC